jgi:tetratricopeptide (TPR) repeat protein
MSLPFFSSEGEYSHQAHIRRLVFRFEQELSQGSSNFYLDPTSVEEILEYYRLRGDWEKAHRLMCFAVEQHPYSAEMYYRQAAVEIERQAAPAALAAIGEALRLDPSQPDFLLIQARAFMLLNDWPAARDALHRALDQTNEPAEVYYLMGRLHAEQNQASEAIKYYWQALQIDAEVHEALYELLHCLEFDGREAEGPSFCRRFLDDNPFSDHGWYCLGSQLQRAGLYEQAEQAYEYALIIRGNFLEAYHGRADSLINLEKYEVALGVLTEAIFLDPRHHQTLLLIGECYEQLERFDQAQHYYHECTRLYPELPEGWFGLGSLLEARQMYIQAVHFFRQALTCDDEYFDAWLRLADCEYELGNPESAFHALQKAIQLDPGDIQLWTDWADRFLEEGKLESALQMVEQGLDINPQAVVLLYRHAALLFKSGEPTEAFAQLENALLLDFDRHSLLYDFCPQIVTLRPIQELIEQYRKR